MKKALLLGLIFTLILAFAVLGCSSKQPTAATNLQGPAWAQALAPLPQPAVVKVGMKEVVSDAGLLVGMAKGYYADLGITIEPVRFNTGQEMINQLAAGQLDVGCTVTAAGLFNAMSRDIPVKIVADKGINVPNQGYYRLVIRKDLVNEIKDFKDLKGRKLAVVGTASLDEICLVRVLAQGGLTTNDIDLQVIRSFPDMLVSLSNKSIDGAMLIEPFIAQGIAKGVCDPWKDPAEYDPEAQVAILVYGTSMASKPDVANRFMTAYIKSLRDYNDAFFNNKGREEMIDLLCKTSVVKDKKLYQTMFPVGFDPNAYVRVKGIDNDLAWYRANNLLKTDIRTENAVNNQYVDFAISVLGKR